MEQDRGAITKSRSFKIVVAINVGALAILFATWWANGGFEAGNDTWLYVTAALALPFTFLSFLPKKKQRTGKRD